MEGRRGRVVRWREGEEEGREWGGKLGDRGGREVRWREEEGREVR